MALQLSNRLALGGGVASTYYNSNNKDDYTDYGLTYTAAPSYDNSIQWLQNNNNSVMLRINGRDPQRRKMYNSSFWYAYNGYTELTASGLLYIAPTIHAAQSQQQWCSYVVCIADVIVPFIDMTQSDNDKITLLHDTTISVLIHNNTTNTNDWWHCEIIDMTDLADVNTSISILSQSSSDWKVGWTSGHKPLSLYNNSHIKALGKTYANIDQPKSSTVCILRVLKPIASDTTKSSTPTTTTVQAKPTSSHFRFHSTSANVHSTRTPSQCNHIQMHHVNASKQPYNKYVSAARLANTPDEVIEAEQRVNKLTNHFIPQSAIPKRLRHPRYNDIDILNQLSVHNKQIWSQYVQPNNIPQYTLSTWASTATLQRGSRIYCIASPYGALSPTVFSNSVNTGVVSNFVTASNRDNTNKSKQPYTIRDTACTVLVIDARCLPGSQGAPVYDHSGRIVGLLTLPLRHTASGSAVELNLAISIDVIAKYIHTYFIDKLKHSKSNHNTSKPAAHPLMFNSQSSALFASAQAVNTHSTSAQLSNNQCKSEQHSVNLSKLLTQQQDTIQQDNGILYDNQLESDDLDTDTIQHMSVESAVSCTSRWVTLVRIGHSWASAICISSDGYYVTNAHLVRPFVTPQQQNNNVTYTSNSTLQIRIDQRNIEEYAYNEKHSSHWYNGTVVWLCNGNWDIAVLKCDTKHLLQSAQFPVQNSILNVGTPAAVIGFPLFAPVSELQPSVCVGVLSKIVSATIHNTQQPILLQSDTCVHNGNSGGLLIDIYTGTCIGMVTSNVLHSSMDPSAHYIHDNKSNTTPDTQIQIIPRLNFSIPYTALQQCAQAVQQYCSSADKSLYQLLQHMDSKSAPVQAVWQLELPHNHDMDLSQMGGVKYKAYIKQLQSQEQTQQNTKSKQRQQKLPIPRL